MAISSPHFKNDLSANLNELIKAMISYGEETSLPFERQSDTISGRLLYVALMNTDNVEMRVRISDRLAALVDKGYLKLSDDKSSYVCQY